MEKKRTGYQAHRTRSSYLLRLSSQNKLFSMRKVRCQNLRGKSGAVLDLVLGSKSGVYSTNIPLFRNQCPGILMPSLDEST